MISPMRRSRALSPRPLVGMTIAAILLALGGPTQAKVLSVGPDQTFKLPSAAIAAAADGDTVEIAPGDYFDCAIVAKNQLTIVGTGPDAVLTDKTCEGKAVLVIRGHDVTVRNLTLSRARVPDGNGAGIRAEGANLTIEQTRFINDQDGILANDVPGSTIRILDSRFEDNGRCNPTCAHGATIGHVALLQIERTTFTHTLGGDHVKSSAQRTELIDDDIEDGPKGTSNYLVEIYDATSLVMRNDTLEKGPLSTNLRAAVMLSDRDKSAPAEWIISHNHLTNDTGRPTIFIANWSGVDPTLDANSFAGEVTEASSQGYLFHVARGDFRWIKDTIWHVGGAVKRGLAWIATL